MTPATYDAGSGFVAKRGGNVVGGGPLVVGSSPTRGGPGSAARCLDPRIESLMRATLALAPRGLPKPVSDKCRVCEA